MKPTALLLTLTPTLAIAQGTGLDCFDNVCCINGQFFGPVISSFSASFSSRDSSRSVSESSRESALTSSFSAAAASRSASQDSVRSSLSVQFSTQIGAAMVTPRAVIKRAVSTEVRPGLTCIGDAVSTVSGSSATTTEEGGSSATGAGATSTTSSSTAGAAVMTQAPILAVGAAAAIFAYGAM